MARAADSEAELDADGIVIQWHRSRVLVVVPPNDFGEESLRYARSSLHNVSVGTWSVSTAYDEAVKGRHQDEFLVDGQLIGTSMDEFSGVIFVGGEGATKLADQADVLRLAREAAQAGKPIGAWGHSVAILARAGVLEGTRVTGAPDVEAEVRRAGGKFSGRELEVSGSIVTSRDEAVGMRFGRALAEMVGI